MASGSGKEGRENGMGRDGASAVMYGCCLMPPGGGRPTRPISVSLPAIPHPDPAAGTRNHKEARKNAPYL
ncbi:MAG: hypothetical protein IKG81_03280 [Bacteroidales bacterium]|nr:hypothetical protein [Bacteroidales bacterium]